MGIPVLILGESGSGKSCSLRNFNKDDLFYNEYISNYEEFTELD